MIPTMALLNDIAATLARRGPLVINRSILYKWIIIVVIIGDNNPTADMPLSIIIGIDRRYRWLYLVNHHGACVAVLFISHHHLLLCITCSPID